MIYYNADYYYWSEEAHGILKETTKEYGVKYGTKVDASKRDNVYIIWAKEKTKITERTINF